MAELSEAIGLDEIAAGLPRRIHKVTARQVAEAPDRIALVENGASWSYRDLGQGVVGTLPPGVEGRIRTLDGIPPKIVVIDVLPRSSTGKSREHELAGCLHRDRAAARQAAKFHRRTHLT